ncbi:MAG: TrmH family RNA methyltransferase [Thermonemataceae bacterium]
MQNKRVIWQYLSSFLTENKKQLFENVLANRTRYFTIAAEDTFDERNASALVRTAECLGIQDVHIVNNGITSLYKLSKGIVKGSHKWMNVHIYSQEHRNNTQVCLEVLKAQHYQIIATTPHKEDVFLEDFDINQKAAFFFGTEQFGLSETVLKQADGFLKIPLYGFTESYNISVAVAILLHYLTQQLRSSAVDWQLSEEEQLDLRIEWALKCIKHGKKLLRRFLEEESS